MKNAYRMVVVSFVFLMAGVSMLSAQIDTSASMVAGRDGTYTVKSGDSALAIVRDQMAESDRDGLRDLINANPSLKEQMERGAIAQLLAGTMRLTIYPREQLQLPMGSSGISLSPSATEKRLGDIESTLKTALDAQTQTLQAQAEALAEMRQFRFALVVFFILLFVGAIALSRQRTKREIAEERSEQLSRELAATSFREFTGQRLIEAQQLSLAQKDSENKELAAEVASLQGVVSQHKETIDVLNRKLVGQSKPAGGLPKKTEEKPKPVKPHSRGKKAAPPSTPQPSTEEIDCTQEDCVKILSAAPAENLDEVVLDEVVRRLRNFVRVMNVEWVSRDALDDPETAVIVAKAVLAARPWKKSDTGDNFFGFTDALVSAFTDQSKTARSILECANAMQTPSEAFLVFENIGRAIAEREFSIHAYTFLEGWVAHRLENLADSASDDHHLIPLPDDEAEASFLMECIARRPADGFESLSHLLCVFNVWFLERYGKPAASS